MGNCKIVNAADKSRKSRKRGDLEYPDGQRAVVYLIQGDRSLQLQFEISYRQLRRWYRGMVFVVSDLQDGWTEGGYKVRPLRHPTIRWGGKTVLFDYVRAKYTLFLDCDTIVVSSLAPIWRCVKDKDFAIARDFLLTIGEAADFDLRYRSHEFDAADIRRTMEQLGDDHPYYNCGVIAWRHSPAASQLFASWHREWSLCQKSEQYPLVRAMKGLALRIGKLPQKCNAWSKPFRDLRHARQSRAVCVHFWGPQKRRMAQFVQRVAVSGVPPLHSAR